MTLLQARCPENRWPGRRPATKAFVAVAAQPAVRVTVQITPDLGTV
jgi:hypothetical protein